MLRLNILKAFSGIRYCFIPGHFLPWIINTISDHWYGNTVFMRRITKRKTTLYTSVALIRFTVFVGRHTHYFIAFHFGFKRTADTAIGAGGNHRMFGLTCVNNTFLGERCRRASIHTGTTGHAVRIHEAFSLPSTDLRAKAPAIDG
ncbi:MAG: Uncharacterised protein [Porticoccaceae bacterium UBA1117]|nr:MAG: Uncharacterised protein [Porticoccaceae bacterium UBA1117]